VGAQPGGQAVTGSGARPAREEVLARVRFALARPGDPAGPVTAARQDGDPWTRPAGVTVPRTYRTRGEHTPGAPQLLDLLADRLLDYRARVHRCAPADLPAAVARALATAGVASLAVPAGVPAEALAAVHGVQVLVDGGSGAQSLTVAELDTVDAVLTGCAVAVADTGTLVLDGGPDQGRRVLTLLPDRHLVVVRAEQVVQTVPEALHRLDPGRPLTMISGPSATSDIELDRVEGVHGPRSLVVLLVG
jgi:L-lactate dehydrogenase complex protein LldG